MTNKYVWGHENLSNEVFSILEEVADDAGATLVKVDADKFNDTYLAALCNTNDIDPEDVVCVGMGHEEITALPYVNAEFPERDVFDLGTEVWEYLSGERPFYNLNEEVVQLPEL